MPDRHPRIQCSVVTPEAQVVDVKVLDVVLPAHDGLLGVLPSHAPMLFNLGAGLMRYKTSASDEHLIYIEGGFGHVCDDEVTILTRRAVTAEMMTETEAREMLINAQDMPSATREQIEKRNAAIKRAKALLAMVEGL